MLCTNNEEYQEMSQGYAYTANMTKPRKPNQYRTNYEKQKEYGYYDTNMEYKEHCDVQNGSWVLITRTIPVEKKCRPHLYGIYWGMPKQDSFDRQVCIVHTTEDVTLLNHEYTVLDEQKVQVYRKEGWELHETNAPTAHAINTQLLEKGRALCEEEREVIWALQLDGLTESQACEEYFLCKHTEYNNSNICYLPNQEVYAQIAAVFGEER